MAFTLAGSSLYAETEKKDKIHMFPQAKEGFVRYAFFKTLLAETNFLA